MKIDTKVKRSLTELNYIINNMSKSLQEKIPNDLRESIKNNMDDEYILDIDISKKYTEQNFMPETRALLSIIISEYIGNDECKKNWKEFDKKYLEILQENIKMDIWEKDTDKKSSNLIDDNVGKENQKNNEKIFSENDSKSGKNQLMKYDESFIKRLFNKIIKFFKKGDK